jgi:hypothetical protein
VEGLETKQTEERIKSMKSEEVRQRLEQLSAEDLRLVAAQLYKMLPKKRAEEKGADRLLRDPQGFLKSAKAARLPALPDIDMVEFETSEFLENARDQRYFAPNRIISKSERGKWRFVARQLYKDWCLLAAAQPENLAQATKALEDLYRILCRGCEVYLFPSTDTFRAIGVPQPEFVEQLLLLEAQHCPPNEWISKAFSLVHGGAHGDSTTAQLQDAFVRTLKTTELKELAIGVISGQLERSPKAAAGGVREASRSTFSNRRNLLRLGFQTTWALGEKERAVQWLQTRARGEDNAGHLVMQLLLETKDREIWMREYETIRLHQPLVAERWLKTFEHAQRQGELPAWQV